jgi:hypothetical protein
VKITLYDFNRGSHPERIAMVWRHGMFLAFRTWGLYRVYLFYMGEFFAEVYFRVLDNQVSLVRGFKNSESLEPYLYKIGLNEII